MVLAKNLDCLLTWRRALLKFRKPMSSRGQLNVPSSMFKQNTADLTDLD
jgi:hypothetical protein